MQTLSFPRANWAASSLERKLCDGKRRLNLSLGGECSLSVNPLPVPGGTNPRAPLRNEIRARMVAAQQLRSFDQGHTELIRYGKGIKSRSDAGSGQPRTTLELARSEGLESPTLTLEA